MPEPKEYSYWYETKCRRCGTLAEWAFRSGGGITPMAFDNAMTDKIAAPRSMGCKRCQKNTVHDVVSYGADLKQ